MATEIEAQRYQQYRQQLQRAYLDALRENTSSPQQHRRSDRAASAIKGGSKVIQTGARTTQTAAQVGETAAAGVEVAAKTTEMISKGVGVASKGISQAGKALTATKLGAIVGAPMMALGGAGQAFGKGGETVSEAVGSAAKGAKQASKAVKDGAKNVAKTAGNVEKAAAQGISPNIDEDQTSLYAPKRQYADPGQFAGKTLPGGAPQPLQQFNPPELRQPTNALHASRASALASNRFQQGLSSTPPLIRSQFDDQRRASSQARSTDTEGANQAPEQSRLASMLQNAIAQRTAKQQAQQQQEQQVSEETTKERDKLKQTAKATMRRGAIYVVDLLAAALDISSSGISFIVDIAIYIFTLGWLNLEMIYGKYLAKGKSRYVSPISWDPIPMPVDKDAIILSGFIVAADLTVAVAFVVLAMGGMCMLYDFVKVTESVSGAIQIGTALAQGGAGGLCLGGIITSAFGL